MKLISPRIMRFSNNRLTRASNNIKSSRMAVICKYPKVPLDTFSGAYGTWFYIKQLTGFNIIAENVADRAFRKTFQ